MSAESTFQQSIHSSLKVLQEMLDAALEHTEAASNHVANRERTAVIDSWLLPVGEILTQANAVYNAILVTHRYRD